MNNASNQRFHPSTQHATPSPALSVLPPPQCEWVWCRIIHLFCISCRARINRRIFYGISETEIEIQNLCVWPKTESWKLCVPNWVCPFTVDGGVAACQVNRSRLNYFVSNEYFNADNGVNDLMKMVNELQRPRHSHSLTMHAGRWPEALRITHTDHLRWVTLDVIEMQFNFPRLRACLLWWCDVRDTDNSVMQSIWHRQEQNKNKTKERERERNLNFLT